MAQSGCLAGEAERSTEQPRLLVSLPGQLRTADPPRETEVVADQRTGARLSTEGLPLYDHGAKTFGGPVDRGAQPGGSRPDDDEIKVPHVRQRVHPERRDELERVGDLGVGRVDEN